MTTLGERVVVLLAESDRPQEHGPEAAPSRSGEIREVVLELGRFLAVADSRLERVLMAAAGRGPQQARNESGSRIARSTQRLSSRRGAAAERRGVAGPTSGRYVSGVLVGTEISSGRFLTEWPRLWRIVPIGSSTAACTPL